MIVHSPLRESSAKLIGEFPNGIITKIRYLIIFVIIILSYENIKQQIIRYLILVLISIGNPPIGVSSVKIGAMEASMSQHEEK